MCVVLEVIHRYNKSGPQTERWRIAVQGMYEYGVEYGIIQDGEISEVRLRGDGHDRPPYLHIIAFADTA